MARVMVMRGRPISEGDLALIGGLLAAHPDWDRTCLSHELCARWQWRNALGRPKDMAARTPLLKLERPGYIQIPPRQAPAPNGQRNRNIVPVVLVDVLGEEALFDQNSSVKLKDH